MKPESFFYKDLNNLVKKPNCDYVCKLTRIENSLFAGFPDVFYRVKHDKLKVSSCGVIELKYLSEPPKRPDTPIKLDHFTKEQINFLKSTHDILGCGSFLFLKINRAPGNDFKPIYLLFLGKDVREVKNSTFSDLLQLAFHVYKDYIDANSLVEHLTLW